MRIGPNLGLEPWGRQARIPGRLPAGRGTFTQTGQDAALRVAAKLVAGAGTFIETGQDATLTVAGLAPVNTVAPAVTGTTTSGSTLTITPGTWTGDPIITYAYQWYQAVTSGGVPVTDGNGNYVGIAISGATSSSYVLQVGDVGEYIFCDETASNGIGSTVKSSNYVGLITSSSVAAFGFYGRAPLNRIPLGR